MLFLFVSMCVHAPPKFSFPQCTLLSVLQILFQSWRDAANWKQKAAAQAAFKMCKAVRLHTASAMLWAPEIVSLVSSFCRCHTRNAETRSVLHRLGPPASFGEYMRVLPEPYRPRPVSDPGTIRYVQGIGKLAPFTLSVFPPFSKFINDGHVREGV